MCYKDTDDTTEKKEWIAEKEAQMRRYFLASVILLVTIMAFIGGRFSVKPIIITKEVIKEVETKVYDLSQSSEIMEGYANMLGKTLESKKEVEALKHKYWQDGFEVGYQTARIK